MGTWKVTWMGGRAHGAPPFSGASVMDASSTSAVSVASDWPGKRLIFHTSALCSALYFALPALTDVVARAVCFGTGTRTCAPQASALSVSHANATTLRVGARAPAPRSRAGCC